MNVSSAKVGRYLGLGVGAGGGTVPPFTAESAERVVRVITALLPPTAARETTPDRHERTNYGEAGSRCQPSKIKMTRCVVKMAFRRRALRARACPAGPRSRSAARARCDSSDE